MRVFHSCAIRWVWSVLLILGIVGLTACAKDPTITRMDEDPIRTEDPDVSTGSLWEPGNSRAFMFEDRRASRVGDIVVVRIVEEHSGSKRANTSTDRESSLESSAGGSLFGMDHILHKISETLGISVENSSEFEGEGSTSREDSLTGMIAAKVIEVFPNGDLRIKGKRQVIVNSEKQTMTIRGIVRRIDLDTENTVLSSAVADAEISYTGLGVVDEVQRPGWAMRLWSWISPF